MALTRFQEALGLALDAAHSLSLGQESVLASLASGRVLAEDVAAPFAVPGFDHSAMDGFAIASPAALNTEVQEFDVVGRALAGDPLFRPILPGEAVQIATGAMVPAGTARVVPIEASEPCVSQRIRLRLGGDGATHIRGADDDYRAGQLALSAGRRVDFAAAGVLASFGMQQVNVRRRARVTVLVTGSELVRVGTARAPGRIHDSNGSVLRGLLRSENIEAQVIGPLIDDPQQLRAALLAATSSSDLVITTGGASAGQADFMPALLAELGQVLFWKVAMRPGMPVLCARVDGSLVFGLPGNPVAVVAGFLSLVRPVLRALHGEPPPVKLHARLQQALEKTHARLEFRRALLSIDVQGIAQVAAHPALSSGVLRSVAETNALILLDAERRSWQSGEVVEVLSYVPFA
jgi:molybdopterin molybdotransferase